MGVAFWKDQQGFCKPHVDSVHSSEIWGLCLMKLVGKIKVAQNIKGMLLEYF